METGASCCFWNQLVLLRFGGNHEPQQKWDIDWKDGRNNPFCLCYGLNPHSHSYDKILAPRTSEYVTLFCK